MPELTTKSREFQEELFPEFFRDWVTGTSQAETFLPRFSVDELTERCNERDAEAAPGFREGRFLDRWEAYLEEHGASGVAMENFRSLRDGTAAVVMTGQQPGLFGGPLYTFYKAATACSLANHLSANGVPAVPVFWNHSDDHDLSEIDRTQVLDRSNEPVDISLGLDHQRSAEIRSLSLPGKTKRALEDLRGALRDTEFLGPNVDLLEETRRDNPADWFSGILLSLFAEQGMLLFEPYLARPFWSDLLEEHLTNWSEDLETLNERGRKLSSAGYRQPLDPGDRPNLFVLENGDRLPVRTDGTRTVEDRAKQLREHPEQFSPGAALRPVVQDAFFPVCSYVAGPGEITYHAQLGGLFDRMDVARSPLFPRMSATIIERKVKKVIEKFDLDYGQLLTLPDRTGEILSSSVPASLTDLFRERREEVDDVLKQMKANALDVDENLESPWNKTRDHILEALDRFRENVEQSHRRKMNVGRQQLEKLERNVLPGGKLQERVISPWHYFTLYSRAFAGDLKDLSANVLDRSDRHHFVELS